MKKNIFKVMVPALICALSISGGATAFANGSTADEPMLIDSMEETVQLNFVKYSGKVTSIIKNEGSISITISDEFSEVLVLNTENFQRAYDAVNKTWGSLEEVKEGDFLTIIMDVNSPMTMSLPPQANNAAFIIKTDDMMNVKLDIFNDELTSSANDLKLNIAPETAITDIMGSRKIFTSDDIKGAQCAVVYTFTTFSIPAQTTPEAVIVLESAPVEETSYNMPLRATFETMGYDVKWTANDKPIIVSNEDITIELTIGSKVVVINGVEKEIASEITLVNGITCVDSSLLNLI